MKIIVFAGGTGTRMWPLSRTKLPKQFIKIFNGKSSFQLAIDRIEKPFGIKNVLVSTNENYINLVKDQAPQIPLENIVGEPEKRNLAPAIGYNLIRLRKKSYQGPIAIIWADHLMNDVDNFIDSLKKAENIVLKYPEKMVFLPEKPRFANNNLGWIHIGKAVEKGVYEFLGWYYKPPIDECKEMFESREWFWNPGYFVMDIDNVLSYYEMFLPEMYAQLNKIGDSLGTKSEKEVINKIYPNLEKVSFDKGIIEKVPHNSAWLVKTNMGWSDPGTLYALKEALVTKGDDNLIEGNVLALGVRDSALINQEKNKLLAGIGLDGFVVVNTKNAILIVHRDKVLEITDLVEQINQDPKLKKFS